MNAMPNQDTHRFSTLIEANNVRKLLATDVGIDAAIEWCQRQAVTKIYLETFRTGYLAGRDRLCYARDRFRGAGLEVSGCVTTTGVGKQSTGWDIIACYTDAATQDRLAEVFAFTADLFDEIMIDDFWFTDCECADCDSARQARTVHIGEKTYPVPGDAWTDYRCELLVHLAREKILTPARQANPAVKLIIKLPEWYDRYQNDGYEIVRETADFDRIWVGTEVRDYDDPGWGGRPQYQAYFVMRWLGGLGGERCGGGWYDPYGTTERFYVEQARQTVLAGAAESLLFCYGSLQEATGPANTEALRACQPELLQVAEQVRRRSAVGVAAYKPPNSRGEDEWHVFDFVGMLGLPLAPCHEFPADAEAAFFSVHALKDPEFAERLSALVARGAAVLVTDGLAKRLDGHVDIESPNVSVLPVTGDPKSLLELSQADLDAIRQPLLAPLGRTLLAPNRVSLYLFTDGSWVIENFNDQAVTVTLDGVEMDIDGRGWLYEWRPLGAVASFPIEHAD